HIIPTPLQLRHPTGRAEQRRQMSTRGVSPGADVVRIEVVVGSVGANPTHSSLTIFDLRRKRCSAGEAVIDAGHGVSILHQRNSWTSLFSTRVPVPTMDANDHWQQTRDLLWTIEVERQSYAVNAFVNQISLDCGVGNLYRPTPRHNRLRRRRTQSRDGEYV